MSGVGGSFPIAFLLQVQGDQEVKNKIQSVGGAFQNFGTQAETVNNQAAKLKPNFAQAALGISAAAASASSLYFQFDNLEKAQLRVETAEKNLTNARAAVISSQNTINDLVARGKEDTPQYAEAILRASAAQDQLSIAEQKVGVVQGDLSQAQTNFALNIVPTVIGAVSSVSLALSSMNISFTASSVASAVASLGVKAFGVATRLAQLAMGPFGWAMLAIGTVFTLVATNAFGIRDALDSFAKKVEEIFPVLKPVFDFFRMIASTLFPDAKEETKDLSQSMDSEFTNIAATVNDSSLKQEASLQMLSGQFADTNMVASTEMGTLAGNVETQADRIVSAAARAKKAMASIGASPASSSSTMPASGGSSSSRPPSPLGFDVPSAKSVAPSAGSSGFYGWSIPPSTNIVVSVELDGKEIATKINKRRLGDEILGRT